MIVGSDLPPEIYEIVQEAGASNVFWWSNRWRQGKKPPVGNAASEMTNAVPGSSITATQGAGSNQPVSDNDGYDFQGDDILNGTDDAFDLSGDLQMLFLLVVNAIPANTGGTIFSIGQDGANTPFAGIQMRSNGDDISATSQDTNSNFTVSAVTPGSPSIPAVVVGRHVISSGSISSDMLYLNSDESLTASDTATWNTSDTGHELAIGGKPENGGADAIFREVLFVPVKKTDDETTTLAERAASRHGITI